MQSDEAAAGRAGSDVGGDREPERHSLTVALMVMMALIAVTAGQSPAFSQTLPVAGPGSARTSFDIPPQPLSQALVQFSTATGVQVFVNAGIVRGINSPGVSGALAPAAALTQLLTGTGLTYRFTNGNTVAIERSGATAGGGALPAGAIPLDTIDVQGASPNSVLGNLPAPYAGGQVATGAQLGMLGNRNVMDTPFSQTSYTQKVIQDQQARTLEDVLNNDPSVRINTPSSYTSPHFLIRGFDIGIQDVGINGLYGLNAGYKGSVPLGAVERIEVLKGPSTLINGMPPGGSIGGSINLVTKRASDEPLTQLATTYATKWQFGTNVDVGRRFGPGKEFGVRFNGALRDGDTSIDNQSERYGAGSLGVDYRGERVRLSADLAYTNNKFDAQSWTVGFGPALTTVPRAPNASTNFSPPWAYSRERDLLAMAQGEFDLTENITAYAAVGAADQRQSFQLINPTINNAQGDFRAPFAAQSSGTQRNNAAQGGIRAIVNTGPVEHSLNLNVAFANRTAAQGVAIAAPPILGNIYNPVFPAARSIISPRVLPTSEQTLLSEGVSDTLSILDKRLQFTIGVRHQQIRQDSFTSGIISSSYDTGVWSPAYALVVKPVENVSLYANYIEGLQLGTVVGTSFANYGATIPPFPAKQVEAGIKIDWGRFIITASLFQINQPNLITLPTLPLPTQAVSGENRNRGLELNVFGQVTDQIRLLGGVTFYDARQVATIDGVNDGKKTAIIPNAQVNLGAEWDAPFARGLTLTGNVIYTSESYADSNNTLVLPDWTRVDLGARYTFASPWNGKPLTARFNVQNAFGANYWAGDGDRFVFLGSPRTFLLSMTTNF